MLRITIKSTDGTREALHAEIAFRLGVEAESFTLFPRKRSIDAREAPVYVWVADLSFADAKTEQALLKKHRRLLSVSPKETPYVFPEACNPPKSRPVVVGFGPAGIFCALMLARCGLRPIVLERGCDMDARVRAVEQFFANGILDETSNLQFGEGGAGAFSDGKLNTLVKDKSFRGYYVLEQFAKAGAPEEILWLNKPHIGTDLLRGVIKSLRQEIVDLGGEVRFGVQVTGLLQQDGSVTGVKTAAGETLCSDTVVLAIGHSARDTFGMLHSAGIEMEKKPFSVGVRIEHLQSVIDGAQYSGAKGFPPADYKLVCHTQNGRTVYTFCMCPGGIVVAAASDSDGVVTNGMSYHARDGVNANSALLCEIYPEDVPGGLFSGMEFQRELEKAAYRLGGGMHRAPAQTVGDFLAGRPSTAFGTVVPTYTRGVVASDLREVLPSYVCDALAQALPYFGKKIRGFDAPDAVMTAAESRSTSPVRMVRSESMQAVSLRGLYPIGEGAGYAGGIISAAIDGLKCAERIVLG